MTVGEKYLAPFKVVVGRIFERHDAVGIRLGAQASADVDIGAVAGLGQA